ncbi:vesicular-fusion protein SEC18 [Ephemerocybe angulata]|uniref:Vesicular-fusion protein SEC18 n=1 Tax=Ephemerocybe angulata TaxID=980116 RepID=A0A8H6IAM1_9AGAR|nr:vesicular-fusion protein SEC18 [Tulosesus angulatus]
MSGFFSRGGNNNNYEKVNTPPPGAGPRDPYGGPRPPARQAPPSSQYHPPPSGYNDAPSAVFEKRSYGSGSPARQPVQSRHGKFGVVSSPSDALALSNCLVVHPSDFPQGAHVLINGAYALTTRHDNTGKLAPGVIGASAVQRQWIGLSLTGDEASVEPLPSPPHPAAPSFLQSIDIEIGFLKRGAEAREQFDAEDIARSFLKGFSGIVMSTEEIIVFEYHGYNLKGQIKAVSVLDLADEQRRGAPPQGRQFTHQDMGIIMEKTDVTFLKAPDSTIKLKSSAKKAPPNAILAPNFKFEDMGIGGLDTEFSEIFRRAFASRVFPPGLVEKLGIDHVKGIILHGPPGTGKTLIARQIGKMLNAREPKIVNGPEILSKYVGASEENIRKFVAQRMTGTGVGDTVVNQLLSKMDGVDQLNNILIIGMTNRLDMIDEALLRPGRLEVHMEISLPDEKGRHQILNIHTSKMRKNGVMDEDVDLLYLAQQTKNFSGAEINWSHQERDEFRLQPTREGWDDGWDFGGRGELEEELEQVIQNGIIHYDAVIEEILKTGQLFVEQVRTSTRTPLVSILLHGPSGSGKTALAAYMAQASEYPFIKLISPDFMLGYGEPQKISAITKVFTDKWTPMGARFSNGVLQTLLVLLKRRPPKGRRLLVIATSSLRPILTDLGLSDTFDFRTPQVQLFNSDQERHRAIRMLQDAGFTANKNDYDSKLQIGIKKLLSMIEMARQEPENVAERLTTALMGLGM